jgi:hypothetical protein
MAGRTLLFNKESLSSLFNDQPGLLMLGAQQWDIFLELTSEIYDIIDKNEESLEAGVVENKIKTFFPDIDSPDQKAYSFLLNSITKWRTLKDSYDNNGVRYISTTPEGRAFLSLVEQQLLKRPQFTGYGADRLLGSLNKILNRQDTMSIGEATEYLQEEIKKLKDDVERIKNHGVKASRIITHQITPLELFSEAEQAAMSVLVAQDAVKNRIKSVRVELFEGYTADSQSVGKRIELTADFYKALRATEEFQSYTRARDALSYVEGLYGSNYYHKEIPQILAMISKDKIVDTALVANSPLQRFQAEFEMINEQIDTEIARQINILKLQVYYATSGDGRIVQEHLRRLSGLILKKESESEKFLESLDLSFEAGLELDFGSIEKHSLEVPEKIFVGQAIISNMSAEEYRQMVEQMRKSEEASIKQVVDKLKSTIARDGLVILSDYPITMGGIEYYVLARTECFDRSLRSTSDERNVIDLLVNNKRNERFWIRHIPDVIIEVARS